MEAEEARAAMVAQLRAGGVVRSPAVAAALAAIPRHRFIDGGDLEWAYADHAVTVKTTDDGVPISSVSQPTMVATMLELCLLEPGHRVLEIGTGSGYNAALLAAIVGPGPVVSVELDADLAAGAAARLDRLGLEGVEVVTGDGTAGHAPGAPYDRVVVTAGAAAIAEPWDDQLRLGGRLVVPIVDGDGIGVVRCLVKATSGFEELARVPCGFLTMRTP
ncbi:MAG: methyltransferase domain-containing protein [Actinomycetota bacterium]